MPQGLHFSVLGPIRAVRGDVSLDPGHPQQKAVLAALLLREGAQITVDQLVDDVWGADAPRTAVSSLRNYVYRLRQLLDDGRADLIESIGSGYRLAVGLDALDLTVFARRVAEARALNDAGKTAAAEARFSEALALWGGVALAGVPGPLARAQRTALAELRLTVLEELFACRVRLGLGAQATSELALLATENPLRERLHELRMLALYGAGRQAEALEVYIRARRLLAAELGVGPGPGLRRTHQLILAADPALDALTATQPSAAALSPAAPTAPAATRGQTEAPSPGPAHVVPAQLPADLRHFAGRKREVDNLLMLAPDAPPSAAVGLVHGMAGVGKTALAVHAAHLLAPHFPDGQLYVDLRGFDPTGSAAAPADVLAEFLDAFGIAAQRIPATVAARSALFRSVLAGRRVLVLLDNARDAEQVRPLLPGAPGCLTVATSRNPMPGLAVSHQARLLPLEPLNEHEARELLGAALGAGRLDQEPQAVQDIIAHCDGLPLALAIVAARLVLAPDAPLRSAARTLRAAHGRLDAFSLGTDPSLNARAVFSWSYRALTADSARLFRLLALHPGPDFTIAAAAGLAAVAPRQARMLCEELVGANLLVGRGGERFAWHDMLRAYAGELLLEHEDREQQHEALLRLLDGYVHTAHTASRLLTPVRRAIAVAEPSAGAVSEPLAGRSEALDWFSAEHRVILSLLRTAADQRLDEYVRQLAWTTENFMHGADLAHDLLATQQLALEAARRHGDPAAEARCCRGLARSEANLGLLDDARAHAERALRVSAGIDDALARAGTHRTLAWILGLQGDHRASLAQARRALALSVSVHDTFGVAGALNSVGWQHARLGHYRQALTLCAMALRILEPAWNDQLAANIYDSLGFTHERLGRHDEAAEDMRRAARLYHAMNSTKDEATALERLGDIEASAGRSQEARAAWNDALRLFEGLDEPDTAALRGKLAASR